MSTLQIDLASRSADLGPACTKCGGPTRLVGIEPHPTKPYTDLRTYECVSCQALKAHVVPLAS
jgi:hypothetical protein